MSLAVGGNSETGRREGDQVRGTKYEVKELGATELRRHGGRRQSRNDAWGINQSTREDEAPLVRRAREPRIGTCASAICKKFPTDGQPCAKLRHHAPLSPRLRYFVLRTSYLVLLVASYLFPLAQNALEFRSEQLRLTQSLNMCTNRRPRPIESCGEVLRSHIILCGRLR